MALQNVQSHTDICNMALAHLGVLEQITNFETDRGAAALACRTMYATARDALFEDFAYPRQKKIQELELIEEDPTDEWAYSYQLPPDCLAPLRILSGLRNDDQDSKARFLLYKDEDGDTVIYTDVEDAQLEFVVRDEDVTRYPARIVLGLSFLLASYIAPMVTSGDPFKKSKWCLDRAAWEISRGQANALNQQAPDRAPEAESIRARY